MLLPGLTITAANMTLALSVVAFGAMALAAIIDPKTSSETWAKVTNQTTEIVSNVVKGAGTVLSEGVSAVGKIATAGFSSLLGPIIVGFGAFYLWKRYNDNSKTQSSQKDPDADK